MPLQAVLFDLGNTLVYPRESWEKVYPRAQEALAQSLQEILPNHSGQILAADFMQALQTYYRTRDEAWREDGSLNVLCSILPVHLDEASCHRALRAFYRITQDNWIPVPGAQQVLARLRARGLRLAALSNAADDEDVRTILAKAGLKNYLEFALTSAQIGYRKPHPRSFAAALSRFNLPPESVLMVGDRPQADILGAQKAGLHSLLITRFALDSANRAGAAIQADGILDDIRDLPGWIEAHFYG